MERIHLYTIMREIQNKGLELDFPLHDLDRRLEWVNETPYRMIIICKLETLQLSYTPKEGVEFRIVLNGNTTKITDKFMYEVNIINDAIKGKNSPITILSDEDIYKLTNK